MVRQVEEFRPELQPCDFAAAETIGRQQDQDGTVTDVSRRIAAGAGDQSLHLRPRWADRETFVLEQTRAIYTRGDAGHTPAAYCRMSKESTQSFGVGGHRHTAPTLLSFGSQKGIHIFQRNIVETTILFAQPAQEFLHMPALIPNGGRRQTALV